ncbi:MAG: MarR family transcriptional regulator, partial [Chloroflexi bacterium]|nr:MarR family transcriptional regulator [Chloroflexota bacterium]
MAVNDEPESLDWLLAQICHHHYARTHALLEKTGLYRGQPPLLRALWEQEGLTHNELAERLHITPATITRMLQRMERTGFIYCEPDPRDQRISRVYLTPAGRAVRTEVMSIHARIEDETFSGMTPEELQQVRGYLVRMRDNLRD